jgi:hypothetical protein
MPINMAWGAHIGVALDWTSHHITSYPPSGSVAHLVASDWIVVAFKRIARIDCAASGTHGQTAWHIASNPLP